MSTFSTEGLCEGDVIQILYRQWNGWREGAELSKKWIFAKIISIESGSWPVVRLVDGQLTDLRPYMTWRLVQKARAPLVPREAA